mmetsp:Transcript_22051/g.68968  ORF Transcript_22051/g.68968 Transcript_22051/m.68968 type:complete len:91 (+) Transcript_22051:1-273(+)
MGPVSSSSCHPARRQCGEASEPRPRESWVLDKGPTICVFVDAAQIKYDTAVIPLGNSMLLIFVAFWSVCTVGPPLGGSAASMNSKASTYE